MIEFDPKNTVTNSDLILVDNEWPSFHDAEVHFYNYWKGDLRPDDEVWVGPEIIIDFELCALEHPFFVKIKFLDCTAVQMSSDNPDNMMVDLDLSYEERGFFKNGKPLPPYIVVSLIETFGFHLTFKCFDIEIMERYEEIRKK